MTHSGLVRSQPAPPLPGQRWRAPHLSQIEARAPRLLRLARRALAIEGTAHREAQHQATVYASLRRRLVDEWGEDLSRLRVLDFGAGHCAPMTLLLSRDVAEVVGLDICPPLRDGLLARLRASVAGRPRHLASVLLSYLQERRLQAHLHKWAGVSDLTLRFLRYPGGALPFPDASFDCVTSNAVLQELPRAALGRYAAELTRVLRPGGVLDLSWHSFYSWSGNYLSREENRRNPWGHLLGGRYDPHLNRVTPDEVVEVFAPGLRELRVDGHDHDHNLRGQDPAYQAEAEELLTPELARRLSDYPREWLLTRGYVLRGRRPPAPPSLSLA